MIGSPNKYFEYVADEYRRALTSCRHGSYDTVSSELLHSLPSSWARLYRLMSPASTNVLEIDSQPHHFLLDQASSICPSGASEHRVVVAYGRSRPKPLFRQVLTELEEGLLARTDVRASMSTLKTLLRHNAQALPAKRASQLKAAIFLATAESGIDPAELLSHRSPPASLTLMTALRDHVAPLLDADSWPRVARSSRQYTTLSGMRGMDVGHFIAHAMGGTFDINLFPQNTELNQGRSEEGKKYRCMERHLLKHPGLLFFSRPVYDGSSWVPRYVELGVLSPNSQQGTLAIVDSDQPSVGNIAWIEVTPELGWWIGVFNNRESYQSDLCSEDETRTAIATSRRITERLKAVLTTKLQKRASKYGRGLEIHQSGMKDIADDLDSVDRFVTEARKVIDKTTTRKAPTP